MTARFKPPVGRMLLIQCAVMLLLAGSGALLSGPVFAYSATLGGLISLVPGAYFAHRIFRETGARATERMVRNAYVGEVVKLAMTGTGFALAFILVDPLHIPGLFAGFVLVHITGIAVLVTSQYRP